MIDGFNLGLPKGTGVATYARNLSHAAQALGCETEVLYGLAHSRPARSSLLREIAFFDPTTPSSGWGAAMAAIGRHLPRPFGVPTFPIPVTGAVVLDGHGARLPSFDRISNATDLFRIAEIAFALTGRFTRVRHDRPIDVAHWTYPLPVRLPGARNVYTMHDLVPLRLPFTTLDDKAYYLRLMRRIVADADHIVTVSETSRDDIVQLLGCPPDKVTNTYQAVSMPQGLLDKSDEEVAAEVEGAFGLPYKGYFLFFGAIEPKKNVGRLVEAYLASGLDEPLFVLGPQGWKADDEVRLIDDSTRLRKELGPAAATKGARIRRFDYAPFRLLVSAIRGAKAVVFPSLYEGFGLPILESMLLGTPVITSDRGAMREVAGDAALLVDPYDPGDIAAAMRRLSSDPALCADLSARGRARAATFSPEAYGARLTALWDRLR
ncbi:glycosyltransferase family 1 protein [Siculibacillus lacustris]|uniref:Glycosyltransferase family 1 protein n=1 Tax=Siculibacillus lacustris TaxID=1549641 RepID=A0A4Q9VWT6_9HYPH|nr:glycosyltransferase family 1 protein [Siculibacillus lacustris]